MTSLRRFFSCSVQLCGVLAVWVGLQAGDALGESYQVTTTLDVIDAGDDVLSLREAILAARSRSGKQNIVLTAGTYTLTLTGLNEDGSQTGDLDLTGNIAIVGTGVDSTIIDGNAVDRIFDIHSGAKAFISGVTIQGGVAGDGAGIMAHDAEVTIYACSIANNQGSGDGGGIFANLSLLRLEECSLVNNRVNGDSSQGAGIYCIGCDITLKGCSISDNRISLTSLSNESGGGVHTDNSILTILDCHFINNRAYLGGGLFTTNSAVVIHDSSFDENIALFSGEGGGAMCSIRDRDFALQNCTLSRNIANGLGGGLYAFLAPTSMTIRNSHFADNSARVGGGALISSEGSLNSLDVVNCSFLGNVAERGGGLELRTQTATIRNSLFAGNFAVNAGGGIFTRHELLLTIRESIVADNNAPMGGDLFNASASFAFLQLINSIVVDIAP